MGFWTKIYDALCSPGRQHHISCAAPTQFVSNLQKKDNSIDFTVTCEEHVQLYTDDIKKKSRGGRFFDNVTYYAGSRIAFIITILTLLAWAIAGIVLGAPDSWQIVMQDMSSIQCYVSDTLLMRQQQNNSDKLLTVIAQLQSRNTTIVDHLIRDPDLYKNIDFENVARAKVHDDVGDAVKLPFENVYDRAGNMMSMAVGSMPSLICYCVGIFVWVGMGAYLGWSDLWQLYINTAVAVVLTFTSMFLQNTRHRHMEYLEKCLRSIMRADVELEFKLRCYTNNNEPNPVITIDPPKVSRSIRAIDYYGDVVGTGIGASISLCVFAIWLAIGNVMQWSDNWWLIIGTYTGLVGFVDGFVLRNVYYRQDTLLDEQFKVVQDQDKGSFQHLNVPLPTKPYEGDKSVSARISNWMGCLCSKPSAVLFSVIIVIALLCIASGMMWNQTGQLICNTPTMIMEGLLLIILIEAHNISNTRRRVQLHDILIRRLKLIQYVESAAGTEFAEERIDEKQVQKNNEKYSMY